MVSECQGGELNSRPRAYESPALPLSYPGDLRGTEKEAPKLRYFGSVSSRILV
jgi:hypothetical protein